MKLSRKKALCWLAAAVSVAFAALPAPTTRAAEVDAACETIETIWAAGSGQDLAADEQKHWKEELDRLLNTSTISLHHYELGQEKTADSYDPIPLDGLTVRLGARWGAGHSFAYGKSVRKGVNELYKYMVHRTRKCEDSLFVLGGYSQGANVVGQALEELAREQPAVASRVTFSALFGDPKLYLPEGEGYNPPACRGENFSPWRREPIDCNTDEGASYPRIPYLQPVHVYNTGSWCNHDDFICGASQIFQMASHYQYATDGGAISNAALEIADIATRKLPPTQAEDLRAHLVPIAAGTAGLDVVFFIDTTGSMGEDIADALALAQGSGSLIHSLGGRLALVAYRDKGDSYTARIVQQFTKSNTEFNNALKSLSVAGGGDTPEALLHALMTGFNGLEWQNGATKAAVVLTDAGFHNPDKVDGTTLAQVVKRSLEIDPVNVYPVVPRGIASDFTELASATAGKVVENTGDTQGALVEALTKIQDRPFAYLPLADYYGDVGETFYFDANRSFSFSGKIVGYDWDFNGDGEFDSTTTNGKAEHVYSSAGNRNVQVRVRADNDTVASASAVVHVGSKPPVVRTPEAPTSVRATPLASDSESTGSVRLSWAADYRPDRWMIAVDGVPIGTRPGDTNEMVLDDLPRGVDITLGVAGVSADNVLGDYKTATVKLDKPSTPTPAPTPTASVKGDVRVGSTITLSGEGWTTQDGKAGSVIAVQLDEGTIRQTNGNDTWQVVPAKADGTFSVQLVLPDGTTKGRGGSNPAYRPGSHSLQLVTGSLKEGDTKRSQRIDMEVGPKQSKPPRVTKVPKIVGTAEVGKVVRAHEGEWKNARNAVYSFQWLRDGHEIPNADSRRYKMSKEDAGRNLAVQVTATTPSGEGIATSPKRRVAKVVPVVKAAVTKKPETKASGVLRVSLATNGVSAKGGQVTVVVAGKTTRVEVKQNTFSVKLSKLRLGSHSVKVAYSGNNALASAETRLTVRVTR